MNKFQKGDKLWIMGTPKSYYKVTSCVFEKEADQALWNNHMSYVLLSLGYYMNDKCEVKQAVFAEPLFSYERTSELFSTRTEAIEATQKLIDEKILKIN